MPQKTDDPVAACEAAYEKMTPGPWRGDRIDGTVKYQMLGEDGAVVVNGDNGNGMHSGVFGEPWCYGFQRVEDEAGVMTLVSLWPEVMAEVARLRAVEAKLQQAEKAMASMTVDLADQIEARKLAEQRVEEAEKLSRQLLAVPPSQVLDLASVARHETLYQIGEELRRVLSARGK